MKEKILYVHCGYPKTATTMLQKWVFPSISGVMYVGRTYTEQGRSPAESLIMSGIRYQGSAIGSDAFSKGCEQLRVLARSEGQVLISLEGILAQCLVPKPPFGFSDVLSPAPTHREALEHVKAFGVRAGFDVVKPIVTLRRQEDLLGSFFAEGFMDRYSRIPEIDRFDKFVDVLLGREGCVDSAAVDYCALERDLVDVFGEGNYLFLLFDWIKKDLPLFSSRLATFTGASASQILELLASSSPENVRRDKAAGSEIKVRRMNARYYLDRAKKILAPNVSLGLGRRIGPWLARFEYGPDTLKPDSSDLARIRDFYSASNQDFVRRNPDFTPLIEVL